MNIISIYFKGGKKTYDYLLDNPKNYALKMSQELTSVTGVGSGGITSVNVVLVKITQVDVLPRWVTSKITVLNELGNISILKISKTPIARTELRGSPTPKPLAIEHPIVENNSIHTTHSDNTSTIPINNNVQVSCDDFNSWKNKRQEEALIKLKKLKSEGFWNI